MSASLAIPAYNEADALASLLPLLLRTAPVREILVCDNGSTDGTVHLIQTLARLHPRLRLISEPRPGKPAAWNALMCHARSEILIFLDADAVPSPDCLENFLRATEQTPHLIYTGRRQFVTPASRTVNRAVAWLGDPVIELCLAGNLYAVRREPVLRRLAVRGFPCMPDVFAEDIWLQSLFAAHELLRIDAHVDIVVDTLNDYLELHARKHLVLSELRRSYPELAASLEDEFPEALLPWPQLGSVLSRNYAASQKLRWIVGAAIKTFVNTVYRRRIQRQAATLIGRMQLNAGSLVLRGLTAEKSLRALPAQGAAR